MTIIGVHTPETDAEKKTENVERKIKELGITYPVLVDTETTNWKAWAQKWWPTVYLIDKRGYGRYRWEGELEFRGAGGEKKMEELIQALLEEPA